VLTCAHVLEDAKVGDEIQVSAFQHVSPEEPMRYLSNGALVLKVEPQYDLMVLSIRSIHPDVGVVQLATEADWNKMKLGDGVFVVGVSMGNDIAPSFGNLASKRFWEGYKEDRKFPWSLRPQSYFKVTAPVTPGNSGSPIFNEKGQMIGMVHAIQRHGITILPHLNVNSRSDFILDWLLK
jgi:S1-C subfamily serine protease